MKNAFSIKQGDNHRKLTLQLGGSVNTTGAESVKFRMRRSMRAGGLKVDRLGVIESVDTVSFTFTAEELNEPGVYDLEIALTFPGDETEVIPSGGYITVKVIPKLT